MMSGAVGGALKSKTSKEDSLNFNSGGEDVGLKGFSVLGLDSRVRGFGCSGGFGGSCVKGLS